MEGGSVSERHGGLDNVVHGTIVGRYHYQRVLQGRILISDTRVTNPDHEKEDDVDGLVGELDRHYIAEEEITSEDDISSDVSSSDNESSGADIDSVKLSKILFPFTYRKYFSF
jgi:hypothetical protein